MRNREARGRDDKVGRGERVTGWERSVNGLVEWQRGEMVERREGATREGSMRRDDIATVCVRERAREERRDPSVRFRFV
jgi:hypothetical protein